MSETKKNPAEFGYVGDEIIPFTVTDYTNVLQIIDKMLDQETDKKTPLKYKYVNRETGLELKNVTDKNRHLAAKLVDIEKTLSSEPGLSLSPLGIEILRVKMFLQGIHIANIENGVAKHYTEIQAIAEEEKAKVNAMLAEKQETHSLEVPEDSRETGNVSE